jgi:uncharacterized membrane protein
MMNGIEGLSILTAMPAMSIPYWLFMAAFVVHLGTGIQLLAGRKWGMSYVKMTWLGILTGFLLWSAHVWYVAEHEDEMVYILFFTTGPFAAGYLIFSWIAMHYFKSAISPTDRRGNLV